MNLISRVARYLPGSRKQLKDTDPVTAYNLWSESYDAQPGNLMLALDEQMFSGMIADTSFENKAIADIGCGTGRHWNKILSLKPRTLAGYDVSAGMLAKLKEKYPGATVVQIQDNSLPGLEDNSCDIIVSTLTIAHIQDIQSALTEWRRVLRNDGDMFITDYHPEALLKGGVRTFAHNGKTVAVKNYLHKIDDLLSLIKATGFELVSFRERKIDQSVKSFYEEKNALHVFKQFENVPIIYGISLKKKNAITEPGNSR